MKRTITIPIEPLSINKVHCRDQRYLTAAAQAYIQNVLISLSQKRTKKKLKELREYFNQTKHVYLIDVTFYYPRDKFFTKQDQISSRVHDLSNIEKPLIDILFLPKHFGDNPPYKAENLNIDDKYIADLHSHKRAADDYLIEITIEINTYDKLESIDL